MERNERRWAERSEEGRGDRKENGEVEGSRGTVWSRGDGSKGKTMQEFHLDWLAFNMIVTSLLACSSDRVYDSTWF